MARQTQIRSRRWSRGVAQFLIGMFLAASLAAPVQADMNAGEFLIWFGKRAVKELNDPALSDIEREARFREFFGEALDIPAIGRFILGRNWRRASAQERADFLVVFEEMALQRFLPMFQRKSDAYTGDSFDIVKIQPVSGIRDQVLVHTRVIRTQGPPVKLVWRIRERNKQFKILDISVQGLSMAVTLRQEYGAAIRRLGGVEAMVQALREKVAASAFAPRAKGSTQ